jgi:inner membrane protein
LASNWNDPAFEGTWLPQGDAVHISDKGFTGTWNSMKIGSGKSELHLDGISRFAKNYSDIRFLKMVDHYQLNERTIKYGLLVLVLTFAVFFLIQIVGKVTVHPLHYFMIGLALLLFYSLLLSFSEHVGFIPAYIIAAGTIVLLIVWYAKSILKSLKFAFMSGTSLLLLYAFLLVIVNLEIYALIVGSIGLLFVLAAIMSVTRKINFETN